MKLDIQVTLDFLHLESTLFAAEQAMAGGAQVVELSSALLKRCGLQCLRILKDRFPQLALVADLKLLRSDGAEIEAACASGAQAITVCGAMAPEAWQVCSDKARAMGLKLHLDFRDFPEQVIRAQLGLVPAADYVVLRGDGQSTYLLMEEIAFRFAKPIAIQNLATKDLVHAISLGTQIGILEFRDEESSNVKELTLTSRAAWDAVPVGDTLLTPRDYSARLLSQRLTQATPGDIAESYRSGPVLLDKVYPLHRFTKIFGQAVTLKVSQSGLGAVLDFLLQAPAQAIAVIDGSGNSAPVWNGLASVVAMKRNLAGAVVYGAITEVNLVRAKGFPCYMSALTLLPGNDQGSGLANIPLQLGAVRVAPGDWLMGDDGGIICVPEDKVFAVSEQAAAWSQQKQRLLTEIDALTELDKLPAILASYFVAVKGIAKK